MLLASHPPSAEASPHPSVLPQVAPVHYRHRSLRVIAPLVARAAGARAQGALDARGLREALRQRGQTARNAEPVDLATGTTHMCQRMVECGLLTGT